MLAGAVQGMNDLISLLEDAFPQDAPRVSRLIRLPVGRSIVFVGDIHGDRDAVEGVFSRFPTSDHVIVFLGDIVDRGPDSLGALSVVARAKHEAPTSVHLLMGNHEAWTVSRFSPADFWDRLPHDQSEDLAQHLANLPLAAWHPSGTLAVHGALPELPSLDAMNNIELGSEAWRAITWGDWVDDDRESNTLGSRPAFGPSAFKRRSSQLGINVLIRSHQPRAPLYSFNDRCLTLFTSIAYGGTTRRVARWVQGQHIETARDLQLIEI